MSEGMSSVGGRVEELLGKMTLAEKAGQCCGTYVGNVGGVHHSLEDVLTQVEEAGLGFATPFGIAGSPHTDPREVAKVANRLQRRAIEGTRLGVPLLIPVDAVHGHAYVGGAAVYPHNLGLAASWDPDLVRRVGAMTARDVRTTGAHQMYGPTCDVCRDPRWGRTFETFGESPRLVAALVAAKLRGAAEADADVLTTAKHFPAYGDPVRGEDAAPVDVSPATLRRTFLPSFEAAVEAGVDAVMPCYNAVNGVPAHGSERFLGELLRESLGFEGLVVSDWGGVDQLHEDHGVTRSREESVELAATAGLDVISIGGPATAQALVRAVEEGALDEAMLDESARRVLEVKRRLGLFEEPYVDPDDVVGTLGDQASRELAREAARKSITLLQNDGLLPLAGDENLLVAGPNADDLLSQVGGWSVEDRESIAGTSLAEGLADRTVGRVDVESAADDEGVERAVRAAADADVAVLALGESWYIHEFAATSPRGDAAEFPSRLDLSLPDRQERLLRRIHETGTPTVLVLVAGRPLAVPWAAANLPAVLWAPFPGSEGGPALADVLFGDADPGGRLPISVPRSTGHLPTLHDHLPHPHPIGADGHPPAYDPLYAFGHGLSYTEFDYRDLEVIPADADRPASVRVVVENVGDRPGEEVVQFYARDRSGVGVQPVRELCGFRRVQLDPGATQTVQVRLGEATPETATLDAATAPVDLEVSCAGATATFAGGAD